MSSDRDPATFPLHLLVWRNDYQGLEAALRDGQHDINLLDPRGRSALHLAISLGHLESVRILLRHKTDVSKENSTGWTALQEAVSTSDPELVQLVLQFRDYQRATERLAGIPELLRRLRKASDFYVEMKWEFTSWVPLVSKICPSDVYRVWKSGANLRVDTTLLGFEHMTWQRGKRSYIFKGEDEGAVVMEVDHEKQMVFTETLSLALHEPELVLSAMQPSEEHIAGRLTSPIVSTHLDTKHIAFERNKSGIWGWRSEKSEVVNGYEAKVYSASNVELVTRTRTEHLSDQDKMKMKGTKTPLQSFLGLAEQHVAAPQNGALLALSSSPTNPTAITPEEYFDPDFNLQARDIGRPVELTSKIQRFKANLWLCEDHPLSLVEQVTPIIDLMAISNAHFAKLRDFITLRLPPGFPVKIEIPLFHVLNARITFGNLCGCDEPVDTLRITAPSPPPSPGNHHLGATGTSAAGRQEGNCVVEPAVFDVPSGYTVVGAGRSEPMRDEDDDLLQFAIRQSLLEAGTETEQVTIWEALTNSRPGSNPPPPYDEDTQLERAIQESLLTQTGGGGGGVSSSGGGSPPPSEGGLPSLSPQPRPYPSFSEQLRLAMELSSQHQAEQERRCQQEEEELERILQLSLTEK